LRYNNYSLHKLLSVIALPYLSNKHLLTLQL